MNTPSTLAFLGPHFPPLFVLPHPYSCQYPTYTYPLTPADSSIGRGRSGVRTEKPVIHVDSVQDLWVNRVHTEARDEPHPHTYFSFRRKRFSESDKCTAF